MKNMNAIKLTGSALGTFLLLQASLSYADDTEIFIGANTDVKPNVFFVLDDSGSMAWCLDNNKDAKATTCPGVDKRSRMEVLKESMHTLLDSMEDNKINVGLMSLMYEGNQDTSKYGQYSKYYGWECKVEPSGYTEIYPNPTICTMYNPHPIFKKEKPKVSMPVVEMNNLVRSKAKDKVDSMEPLNNTPASMSIYHAARYLTNIQGKHNDWAVGHGSEKSPIAYECQPTHLVLLTDGVPGQFTDEAAVKQLIGSACAHHESSVPGEGMRFAENCSRELVSWLYEKDHSSLPGKQNIKTHTIGFALDGVGGNPKQRELAIDYLEDLANLGGGIHRRANNATDLINAFKEILAQVAQVENATFVNPVAARNMFSSKLEHKDEVYYPLFLPTSNDRWSGNLKRYKLYETGSGLTYVDVNDQPIYNDSEEFKSTAKSFWSDQADGGRVEEGGAAWKLPHPNSRKLFVEINGVRHELMESVTALNSNLLGVTSSAERKALINYIRGFDKDGVTARRALGDPLHSAPVIYSHAGKQMAVMGSNEGFVHIFDTETGVEQSAFMPELLLKNIKQLYANATSTPSKPHPYGMDNTVTVWNTGSHVYAYATMRRGGRGLYMLDITNPQSPQLKKKIIGGVTPGFERLGQTWSQPVKSKVGGKDVLIFAGGYDPTEDNFNGSADGYRSNIALGNDIYIVDAENPTKIIWSASSSGLTLPAMRYSMPGEISVLRDNGVAKQLFVGDTGGQIWRFEIDVSGNVSAGGENGVFARLGENASKQARRFYHKVDVAEGTAGGGKRLFVNVGSGYHAHPLNEATEDWFYSIQTSLEDDGSNKIIKPDNLLDVTERFDDKQINLDIKNDPNTVGWRFKLSNGKGEKVVSAAMSLYGTIYFNTYLPGGVSANPCQPALGTSYSYAVQLLNGVPPVKKGDPAPTDYAQRYQKNSVAGLPGNPGVIVLNGKLWVQRAPGKFTSVEVPVPDAGKKSYWMELE